MGYEACGLAYRSVDRSISQVKLCILRLVIQPMDFVLYGFTGSDGPKADVLVRPNMGNMVDYVIFKNID